MKRFLAAFAAAALIFVSVGLAKQAPSSGPYKILKTVKAGGEGGFDYIFADVGGRRLYVPRRGAAGLMVFNVDTLQSVGSIPSIASGGVAVDPKSHHGFSNTKPITMWNSQTLKVIKKIDVGGNPDGMLYDPYNERVWVFSHQPPYATVIDGRAGTVVGTIDLGGAPEQAVSDGKGTVYVNISNNANIAVVDARNMKVTAHYDVSSKGTGGSGLALDAKNHILFAYYRQPSSQVIILNAENGHIITTLPTGMGVDTAVFNPNTMEAISGDRAGTMTFIKENSPTSFSVEQTLKTMPVAKTVTLDLRTNHVFTMTAAFGPAPAPPPGAQPGRGGRGRGRAPMLPGSFTVFMIGR
jgi:DNA-binding beta-propeller fold protein YncE